MKRFFWEGGQKIIYLVIRTCIIDIVNVLTWKIRWPNTLGSRLSVLCREVLFLGKTFITFRPCLQGERVTLAHTHLLLLLLLFF